MSNVIYIGQGFEAIVSKNHRRGDRDATIAALQDNAARMENSMRQLMSLYNAQAEMLEDTLLLIERMNNGGRYL